MHNIYTCYVIRYIVLILLNKWWDCWLIERLTRIQFKNTLCNDWFHNIQYVLRMFANFFSSKDSFFLYCLLWFWCDLNYFVMLRLSHYIDGMVKCWICACLTCIQFSHHTYKRNRYSYYAVRTWIFFLFLLFISFVCGRLTAGSKGAFCTPLISFYSTSIMLLSLINRSKKNIYSSNESQYTEINILVPWQLASNDGTYALEYIFIYNTDEYLLPQISFNVNRSSFS